MVERRDFKRLPAECEINIRQVPAGSQKRGAGKNISGGGVLLSASERFEPDELLDIEVLTRTHRKFSRVFRPMTARVRVVRVDGNEPPYDVAAEFVEVER
ncbi:MAG TPA: PilZ domain-containing protein [Myxococcota bacterium]|nr:PilZ domain-containing protein [Myxococcota bacterium]